MVHLYGLKTYADIMSEFAAGERCSVAGPVKLADQDGVHNSIAYAGPDGREHQAEAVGVIGDFLGDLGGRRRVVFFRGQLEEDFGIVPVEAMACGIPCVTTRITGIPELIRSGKDGLLVTPSDSQALAAALARLMDDTELRTRLAHDGRDRVREHYDLERNVGRLGQLFEVRLGESA